MDRLKLLFWDGTGLVMAYKRLEDATFTWPAIRGGVIALKRDRVGCDANPPPSASGVRPAAELAASRNAGSWRSASA
ncbi:MAG: transposase, partial [Rhodobacterales bacterium]|nr:transposase [Rhodobacterales bacterium]